MMNIRKTFKMLKIIFSKKTIIFLVHYPSDENLKDGYYQRIFAMDNYLSEHTRIYVNFEECGSDNKKIIPKVFKIKNNVFQINAVYKKRAHQLFLVVLVFFIGKIYSHSILKLHSKFDRLLFALASNRVLDLHGSVPEEFQLQGDNEGFKVFNSIEKFAVNRASVIIGVTQKMIDHIIEKHKISSNKKIIVLPILPEIRNNKEEVKAFEENSVIYCGGLQKWQQIEKMLNFVYENKDIVKFAFLVPDPEKLKEMYKDKFKQDFPGIVQSVESGDVAKWYKKYSFGFVLREDIVVNNVACPTKLIEYLQYDLIPIVDSDNIGDFKNLGYERVYYKNKLPGENNWMKMIMVNRNVLNKIYEIFNNGADSFKKSI